MSLLFSIGAQDCIRFTSPSGAQIIESPQCTLAVEDLCQKVRRVEFQARYLPADNDTPKIISLAKVYRAPFQTTWDISTVPNQLISGAGILAVALFWDGHVQEIKREGIFFAHRPISSSKSYANYSYSGTHQLSIDTLFIGSDPTRSKASITWNEDQVSFYIDVTDKLFYTTMAQKTLSSLGVEILLDPLLSRKPYPGPEVLVFAVPLTGRPYKVDYKPVFGTDGSFQLSTSTSSADCISDIVKSDFKGFTIFFAIPKRYFGESIPESFGCNIVLKITNGAGGVKRIPWIGNSIYDSYSPLLWSKIEKKSKPLYMYRSLQFAVSFIIGILFPLLMGLFLTMRPKKERVVLRIEQSEEEQEKFNLIKSVIDRHITWKDLAIDFVSRETQLSTRAVSACVKRQTGLSFVSYIMYCRVEISKERLRSSHSTEAAIAESCGFTDVNEMERYFIKFLETTPFKFRMEQQVA